MVLTLNQAEQATVRIFKEIADSALEKIAKLNVQSSNKFWTPNRTEVGRKLAAQRDVGYASEEDVARKISASKVGNCGEKGMAFAWFASRHPKAKGKFIYTVYATDWDHMWAVMTEKKLASDKDLLIVDLGMTGIVMDGWTEDWYFPNMPAFDKLYLNTWRSATPFALWAKNKVETTGRRFRVNGSVP